MRGVFLQGQVATYKAGTYYFLVIPSG